MHNEPLLPFQVDEICADRYRIERVLGRGGMGVVYAALHCFTGGRVALKALYEPEEDLPARMEQEARALAAIRHRHVVRVLDGGATARGVVWFAMELLEGCTLRDRLCGGPLPLPRALRYAREIAGGLEAAHAAGVVHRDLKPENVFVVEPEDEIRVLDFGTAKFRRGSLKTTHRMRLLGTYAYMAPERFQGQAGDPCSDVYSLGHVLYELVCGRHAFSEGPGPLDLPPAHVLGMRHMASEPPPVQLHRPELSDRIAELVHSMLEKRPEDRPQTLGEVVQALETAGEGVRSRTASAPRAARADGRGMRTAPLGTPSLRSLGSDAASHGAAALAPTPRTDWLQHLRPGEYPACRSFEAQAILGAVRFASRDDGGHRMERDLAALLSADAAHLGPIEEAALAMTALGRDERAALRARLRDWAGALDAGAATRARNAVMELVEQARTNAPRSFGDDALRATRILVGASTFPALAHRDPTASEALVHLASGSLEDIQLAHFGLLLLTRVGVDEQRQIREALWVLAAGAEARRDGARARLGQLLAACVHPAPAARTRSHRAPRAVAADHGQADAPEDRQRGSVWAASIDRRWVPLILTGALLLGALLAVLGTAPRLDAAGVGHAERSRGETPP